jgi:Mannan-binding protein
LKGEITMFFRKWYITRFVVVLALMLGTFATPASAQTQRVSAVQNGAMNTRGAGLNFNQYLALKNFVINYITINTFNRLWGPGGTVVTDDNYRLDIQNPGTGQQNLQIQRGANTLATVLIPNSLQFISTGIRGELNQREFMNRFRGALLSSAYTVLSQQATQYLMQGSYANNPPARDPARDETRRRLLFSFNSRIQVSTGQIIDNVDAQGSCTVAAQTLNSEWNGQWANTADTGQAVCGAALANDFSVPTSVISNPTVVCPTACDFLTWNGNWINVIRGATDVGYCGCSQS